MWFFLAFLVLLLVLALVNAHVGISLLVSVMLAALYWLSRLWTAHATSRIEVKRRFIDHAFPGEDVDVRLRISNRGALPVPWLEMEEELPPALTREQPPVRVLSLLPGGRRDYTYTVRCRRRGYYTLGPLTAQTGDVLGFATTQLTLRDPSRLIVYPRVVPLRRLGLPSLSTLAALRVPASLFEDPSRVVGVRAYAPGDSLRRIHWGATARTGELSVKQYGRTIARETLLCLDLHFGGYGPKARTEAIEMAITVAASLAHHIVQHERLPVGFATHARDPLINRVTAISLAPSNNARSLLLLLEVLARIEATRGDPFDTLLQEVTARLSFGSTVVVITGSVTSSLAQSLLALRHSGHAVAVIVVQPPSSEALRLPVLPGIRTYRVWNDEDLEVLQPGVEILSSVRS
jgi:uncharacterized protein (DUF58 family)